MPQHLPASSPSHCPGRCPPACRPSRRYPGTCTSSAPPNRRPPVSRKPTGRQSSGSPEWHAPLPRSGRASGPPANSPGGSSAINYGCWLPAAQRWHAIQAPEGASPSRTGRGPFSRCGQFVSARSRRASSRHPPSSSGLSAHERLRCDSSSSPSAGFSPPSASASTSCAAARGAAAHEEDPVNRPG